MRRSVAIGVLAMTGFGAAISGQNPPPRAPAKPPGATRPLKVGDTVEVYSLFGWQKVQITAMKGTLLQVCCVDGGPLTVEVRNLRRVPGTTAPARFAPDPKPDVGCAGKIEGTYSDDLGLLSITFASGRAKVTQFAGTYETDCEIRGDRIDLRAPQGQESFQLTRKSNGTLEGASAGPLKKK